MSLVKCKSCGTEISAKAAACPKCGHPNAQANHLGGGQVVFTLLVAGLGLWWFAGGGFDKQVASDMGKIQDKVAHDAVAQYNIAKNQGDPIQTCVQAGFVAAAYLQAQDAALYESWKVTQEIDCKRAGTSQ